MREKVKSLVQQALREILDSQKTSKEKEKLLVLLVYHSSKREELWEHIRKLAMSHSISLLYGEKWREIPEDIKELVEAVDVATIDEETARVAMNAVNALYVPVVSHGLLTKLALTIDDDFPSWLAIQMQLEGKEVIFASDNISYRSYQRFSIKPSVEKRIASYVRQVQKDGVHVLPMAKAERKLASLVAKFHGKRPLVLARHVEELSRSGERELVLPKRSLITPMGRDAARELGITIKHVEEKGDKP
ncbi:MAG: hypothetical protein LRY73_13280 [Bacillus sp. (in: Bacteria)]|nr:hypothetical protein [Bacillus sp. (in: firmicutes)]